MLPREGYLYIATGDGFLREAEISVRSLKRADPSAHVTLVTAQPTGTSMYDQVLVRPIEFGSWKEGLLYRSKHIYAASPYEKTLFLDTDTYLCESCRELFDILDYYDVCVAHAPNDTTRVAINGKPLEGYHPYNCGVLGFRKSPENEELFRLWLEIFEQKFEHVAQSQVVFMEALARSRSRVYVLQNVYNARTPFHQSFLAEKVKVIHGRGVDFEDVRRRLNATPINRSWDPVARSCQRVPPISYVMSWARIVASQFRGPRRPQGPGTSSSR